MRNILLFFVIISLLFLYFPDKSYANDPNCEGSAGCNTSYWKWETPSGQGCNEGELDCSLVYKEETTYYGCNQDGNNCVPESGFNGCSNKGGVSCVYNPPGGVDPPVYPIGYSCSGLNCTAVYSGSAEYASSTCDGACAPAIPPAPASNCGWYTDADACYRSGGSGGGGCYQPPTGPEQCRCCVTPYVAPPPPQYGCSNNSCAQGTGPYSGNPSCNGSCGIKCSFVSPADTKVASMNFNSKSCNILGQNGVNNPSKISFSCTSVEHAGNTKNWRIQKLIVPDLNGVGSDGIYTSNGTAQGTTNNAGVNLSVPGVGAGGVNNNTPSTKVSLDFNVKLPITNDPNIANTSCTSMTFIPTPTFGTYRAAAECATPVNDNALLRTNSLAILKYNGWGDFIYNGVSVVDTSNPIKGSAFKETFTSAVFNTVTTYYYSFVFDIPTTYTTVAIVNGSSIFCEPILFTSTTATYAVGNISCRGNATTTDIRTGLLQKFNETGLRNLTVAVNNNVGTYTDTTGRIYKDGAALTDSVTAFTATGNTYTNEVTIIWPDGLPHLDRKVKMWITDGTDANCGSNVLNTTTTATCVYKEQTFTVDTSLPVVEREVTVDSSTLLKVVHKATDDYQLKSHAVYCGGTAYSEATSSKSPFISERRLSSDGLSYSYIGAQQIAGYFGADPSIKTCDGSFLPVNNVEQNNDDFKTFSTTSTSDTRSTYYLLDENKLKNQNEPYEITFGDGKDGSSFGRWYAEDNFCNLPASSPKTTVDVGSPWLQTKGGNAYVQGNNGTYRLPTDTFAYNYTVNNVNITTDPNNPGLNICTATKSLTNDQVKTYLGSKNQKSSGALSSYVNRINQCPENTDTYTSSYVMSSAEEGSSNGPRGGDRSSKIKQESVEYNHKLNNISNYTGGDNNLFDYITKTINTAGIAGYYTTGTQVTDTNSELVNGSSQLVIKTYPDPLNGGTPSPLTVNPDAESGNDLIGILDSLIYGVPATGNAVSVYQINTDLIINHNSANLPSEAWEINRNAIILVNGDVYLEPDIIKNGGNLVIVAKGSIVIGNGKYKSASQTKEQVAAGTAYPLYDEIDAFLIADGKVITLPDKGGSSYVASSPIKPAENIASKTEVKLNNDIVKKAEAQTYPCKVYYYKDAGLTVPFTQNESVPAGKNLYLGINLQIGPSSSSFSPAWQYTTVRINGVRASITNALMVNGNTNSYIMIPGSYIVPGNNVIEFGEHVNYTVRTDAITGSWCEPLTLVGTGTTPTISGTVYCRDTNGNKVGVSNTSIVYTTTTKVPLDSNNASTVAPQTVSTIATTDSSGNWSANYSNLKVVWDNRAEPYYYGSLVPTNANYPNGANRLNKASGCFNSNLEEISPKMSGSNMLLDEMNSCGDSNQAYYQSTYSYGGETEDRNNMPLNSINFDLGSCASQNLPTQCTAMTINEGNDDIALTPGSAIDISMTVVNPTDTTNKIVVSNRDHKCNDLRAYRAGLAASNINGYTNMSNSTNTPAQWADCVPPATATQITSVFDTSTFSDNGNLRTYTFKIKAEQVLKTDQNTGLPIKSLEFGGPNVISESLRCKVYAHDNRIVYDGLKIYGGVVQTSTFPMGNNLLHGKTVSMDGVNYNSSLTCKNSGGDYPSNPGQPTTGIGSPCFLRDLIMVQNFVAPAEQIEYDPSFQVIFGSILGRKSTILSIRESTDD